MLYTYPAVFTPMEDESGYYIRFPDLDGCITTGEDLPDAVEMASDALAVWLCAQEDHQVLIPAPTSPKAVHIEENEICTLIQADTAKYRALTDTHAVRKTVSLPAWMATLADRMGLNCSQVLQEALRQKLGVNL